MNQLMHCMLRHFFCLSITSIISTPLHGFDLSVFYHARFAPQEPRFAQDWLSSANMRIAGGATQRYTDECGLTHKAPCMNRYRMQEVYIDVTQNFCNGFFVASSLPFERIHITGLGFDHTFLSNMNITGGWTINYEETESLDFIDCTLETGIIIPTAPQMAQAFGIPLRAAVSLGVYDWITIGLQADITNFFDADNGRLWNTYYYLKMDHFLRGFSLTFGASHSNQTKAPVPWLCDTTIPCWTMDTFHFIASYDTATPDYPWAPHIDFFCNHILNGTNIIHNSIFGVSIGSDF